MERAFEPAFAKALDHVLRANAEALFQKAFSKGSPLFKKLEDKIEQGFERFVAEGIRWEK